MRFLLISLNVILLFLLGIYLLNLFGVRAYDPMTFVFMFVAAVAVVLISNEMVDRQAVSNPVYFIIPGVVAVAAPFIMGKPYPAALALGWLLMAPGIVLLSRKLTKSEKK